MKLRIGCVVVGFLSLSLFVFAQTPSSRNPPTSLASAQVPHLIRFSGLAKDATGKSLTAVVGITFSLYRDQQGGAPLWTETQNVQPDSSGHYTVLLGSTKTTGVPAEMFVSGEAQWLGVQPQGETEQARVLIVSVPYALKALDAETVGGKPASAFMAASNFTGSGSSGAAVASTGAAPNGAPTLSGGGSKDFVPLWLSSTKLGSSKLYQSTAGNVGVGTKTPVATLDVNGTINSLTSFDLGGNIFAFGSYANANAFLGFAGNASTTGIENTASGLQALISNTSGSVNVASGWDALYSNTTGNENTAIGGQALNSNTTGGANTATGYGALQGNFAGTGNTANGWGALATNTASNNTATGFEALFDNYTGTDNTANGYQALHSNSTATDNTASGYRALTSNTTGFENSASGSLALSANTTGSFNTASGYEALQYNNTGYANTANGYLALSANTTGVGNTASGDSALLDNVTGNYNTAVGWGALAFPNGGSYLTCIGYDCVPGADGLFNATAIGAHAVVGESNALVLGGTGQYAVKVGIGTTTPSSILTIARGAGHPVSDSWETYSSRRWKTNIQTLPDALAKVEQLRGVSYDQKDGGKHEVGVIAEEVGKVLPEVVTYEDNGKDARGVDYSRLTALLIEAVKQQQREIRDLKSELRATRQTLETVKAQVDASRLTMVAAK